MALLKKYEDSSVWFSKSKNSNDLLAKLRKTKMVDSNDMLADNLLSVNMIDNDLSVKIKEDKKSKIKVVSHQGHLVIGVIKGNDLELITPNGLCPESLPALNNGIKNTVKTVNKQSGMVVGGIYSHPVELGGGDYYKDGIQINSYMGKGTYLSLKPPVRVVDEFSTSDNDNLGLAFFRINPSANIIDVNSEQFRANKEFLGTDFFAQMMVGNGIDGAIDTQTGTFVMYNNKAIDFHSSHSMEDLNKEFEHAKQRQSELEY